VSTKTLFAFGLNYKIAPVEVREKLYIHEDEIPLLTEKLRETLSECFILSTCNRTEVYGVADTAEIDANYYKDLLIDFKNARGLVRDDHFFTHISCPATQQLFNVATSIDSKVVGDTQILKQIREAYIKARENGSAGKVINQLLQRALKIGKKTYTDTAIHAGAVSVSLAAVELAVETYGSLQGRTVLVLGAGEMARLTAEALVNKHVGRLLISNRTRAHAEQLLSALEHESQLDSEIIDFANFKDHLSEADIVISATGSDDPILR
jgi:glutamyl-tRNA reductase